MKKILLASVLKPVNDVRMYGKIGKALQNAGFETAYAGFGIDKKPSDCRTLCEFEFSRLSPRRIKAGFDFFFAAKTFRPEIIIVCALELLPFAVLYKLLTGTVVIYDLQENYFFNLHYQEHYSFFTRHLAAYAVRFFEKNLIRFVDAAFLAESCYAEEIKYLPEKSILLENKVFRSENFEKLTAYERKNDALNFVISGTLTQTYGTKEGIKFFMELKKKFRFDGKLYVCGYAPDKNYRKEITELCKSEDVVADISASPLPHEKILKVWARCQICLMPYLKNKAIENRIPTKFYEAMAAGKIILTTRNQAREKKFAQCPAFVFYDDANTPEIETVFQATFEKCKEPDFFFDEEKLIAFVKSLNTSNKKRI